MKLPRKRSVTTRCAPLAAAVAAALGSATAQGQTQAAPPADRAVYRCPGIPVLYTDAISPKEARDKGCRTLDNAPITIVSSPKPRATAASALPGTGGAVAPRSADQRIAPAEQRARDSDARRILEAELRSEEERHAGLQQEYNGGEPERRGDERNYQKYLDRVAGMKAALARQASDIAAIKRELAKLGP